MPYASCGMCAGRRYQLHWKTSQILSKLVNPVYKAVTDMNQK